ncbi:MAG TPA: hypothetical protein VF092_09950 [Longimicrobium sp.]
MSDEDEHEHPGRLQVHHRPVGPALRMTGKIPMHATTTVRAGQGAGLDPNG